MTTDQPPTTEATRLSAEDEPLFTNAEFCRFIQEANDQRERAEKAEKELERKRFYGDNWRKSAEGTGREIVKARAENTRLSESLAASERERVRLNGYIAQLVAGDESEIRALWIMAEHNLNQAAQDSTQAEAALAAERERHAPLRAQIKAAQDRADQALASLNNFHRIIGQASAWVLGNRTDEHVASVNRIIEHVAKYGIEPERINQFHISIHERFKIGLLIERIQQQEQALAESRHEVGRLREAGMALLPFLHHGSDQAYPCDSIASLPARDCACGLRGKVADLLDLAAASPAPPQEPPDWHRAPSVNLLTGTLSRQEDANCNVQEMHIAPSGQSRRCRCKGCQGPPICSCCNSSLVELDLPDDMLDEPPASSEAQRGEEVG